MKLEVGKKYVEPRTKDVWVVWSPLGQELKHSEGDALDRINELKKRGAVVFDMKKLTLTEGEYHE